MIETDDTQTRRFGGMTPQEAGQRSAQRRAERKAAEAERDAEAVAIPDRTLIVRTTIHVSKIMKRLAAAAGKGNTQSARELREWMSKYPAEDSTDISALDARTQQEVLARILAEIEADEGAIPEGPLGPND